MLVNEFHRKLRSDLLRSKYSLEERLPTLRALAKSYHVSPASAKRVVDKLREEGLVEVIHGRGIYPAGKIDKIKHPATRIIGMICPGGDITNSARKLSDEWLMKDWILSVYNSADDQQAPEIERRYLERAMAEGFAGVALYPTPIEPRNESLFHKLRLRGMKIAILDRTSREIPERSAFLMDFHHGGYMCVAQMAMRGYKRIVFARITGNFLFADLIREGMEEAARDLGLELLEDINFHGWHRAMDPVAAIDQRVKDHKSLIPKFQNLPENTAIISARSSLVYVINRMIQQTGRSVSDDLGVCSAYENTPRQDNLSCLCYPLEKQLGAAIDFIVNPDIKATGDKTLWFKPEFHGGTSIRNLT